MDIEAMLEALKHRGPEAGGIFRKGRVLMGHRLLSIVGQGRQPLRGCHNGFVLTCNGEVYNHAELRRELGGHRLGTTLDVEVILHLVEENYRGDLGEAVKKVLPSLDGDYAFAVYHRGEIVLARDPLGVKPLYHTPRAFASERKAFGVPMQGIRRLSPGRVMPLGGEEVCALSLSGRKVDSPVTELESALECAVEKRTRDVNVGLLFSAGLDSSLLAWIMRGMGREKNLTLYSSGVEGCVDLEYVRRLGDEFEVRTRIIEPEELGEYVRKVVYAIEDWDPMKVSIALPIYAACELAHEDGLKVMLSGQGADELFAGYHRYLRMDTAALEEALRRDLQRIAETNLERDDAAAMACSVELRVPYLDRGVVEVALGTPGDYKIKDGRRKHILRLLARRKGVPEFIVNRDKKAIQYATGVEKALRKTAREYGKTLAGFLREVYEEVFPWG